MRHFPIFLDTAGRRIVLSGGGEAALAKLRLLLKTEARIAVYAPDPAPEIVQWAGEARLTLHFRGLRADDLRGAALVYAADEDSGADARTATLAREAGVALNVVDNLEASDFITPAMVDRAPLTVAIGTEGTAPVLARAIKADLEARLSPRLGALARAAAAFRDRAETLPRGRARRDFWRDWFFGRDEDAEARLSRHLARAARPGHVAFVGAGPGDPELLTLRARRLLDEADVVIHDRLVSDGVLELARREALMIAVGKEGFGPSVSQEEINRLIALHAARGAQVVRLKGGDPGIFGRLDEEIEALDAAGVDWSITPGITAAAASAASIGQSLTKRGRNTGIRLLTGHDTQGFAEHDWRALAAPGAVAAVYMGKRAARLIQGRLLMHGADPATPVTVIENASRPDERVLATTLGQLEPDLTRAGLTGPALTFLGLAPRGAQAVAPRLQEAL